MRSGLLKASALALGLAAAVSCGGGGGSSTSPSSSSTPTINIVSQNGVPVFSPNPAFFGGQQVVFKNNDNQMHHVILNDGSGDTGDIPAGATSKVVTMPSSGANYHCIIHTQMIGSIGASSGSAPPPCTGAYCDGY
jgi:plastocyanin